MPFRSPQRHGRRRAQGRARAQARLRRGREAAGVAQGPGQFRHRRRPPRRGDAARRIAKARPGYGFLGEEGGSHEGTDKTHTWIVDPLDGTTNFLHGIPQFAISIGLEREGTIVAGVIYNPVTDEMFTAERGKGAFLNDRRLRVAGAQALADSVIACGLPHLGRGDLESGLREFGAVQDKVAGLRRFGSAALDLAFVAAGRFDGYWERNLSPWDIAAGTADGARSRRLRHRHRRQRRHVRQAAYRCRQRDDTPRIADDC